MDPRRAAPGVALAGLDALSVELGFPRNRESLLEPRDPRRAVIGVFGGSVADILSEAGAASLRDALAAAPGLRGREIVVLSVAAPGYKQPQALMTLNYLLALGAHFDAVVNLDGVNDLALPESELAPLGVAPFYPRGWYTRAADLSPELRLAVGRAAWLEDLRRRSAVLLHAPLRWSRTAGLLFLARRPPLRVGRRGGRAERCSCARRATTRRRRGRASATRPTPRAASSRCGGAARSRWRASAPASASPTSTSSSPTSTCRTRSRWTRPSGGSPGARTRRCTAPSRRATRACARPAPSWPRRAWPSRTSRSCSARCGSRCTSTTAAT